MTDPTTTVQTADQRRENRNRRRREQRLADARFRMARHAACELVTWGDDHPVTVRQVIDTTTAMYGNCRQIKGQPITEEEAAKALAVWLDD